MNLRTRADVQLWRSDFSSSITAALHANSMTARSPNRWQHPAQHPRQQRPRGECRLQLRGLRHRKVLRPRPEHRDVASLGNLDDYGLVAALPREVLVEFLAKLRYQYPNQCVVAGVVIGRTPQAGYPDLLLVKSAIRVL